MRFRNWFNTTSESDENVKIFTNIAKKQDERILAYFRKRANNALSAYDIEKDVKGILITSIRRTINTLEKEGKIERCGQAIGPFKVKVNLYVFIS